MSLAAPLITELVAHSGSVPIVGRSRSLRQVIHQAALVAATDSTVLILGETGTGKEVLAQYLHSVSRRSDKTLVTTNVAAIPATLLESELFGREKGAYTGASTRESGRFELADGGTLLLDEIGEMPMETQSKLLRVLQTGEFERLGSGRSLCVNVRLIAATNRNLPELIKAGLFRQDLYFRLNVFPITLPPLRERLEDIPVLVWAFIEELSEKMGKTFDQVCKDDLEALQAYHWPGNIRELRNIVERSMILAQGRELRLILPDSQVHAAGRSSRRLADVEREHIVSVLESTRNRIRGSGGAAEILGLKPSTLYSLMARLGIPRTRPTAAGDAALVGQRPAPADDPGIEGRWPGDARRETAAGGREGQDPGELPRRRPAAPAQGPQERIPAAGIDPARADQAPAGVGGVVAVRPSAPSGPLPAACSPGGGCPS